MKLSDEVGIKSWLVLLYKVLSAAVRNLDLPMYCLCPLVPSAPPVPPACGCFPIVATSAAPPALSIDPCRTHHHPSRREALIYRN